MPAQRPDQSPVRTILGIVWTSLCWALLATAVAHAQPNVLMIMTDDQGYSDVGFNGNPILRTPELDRLARSSLVFDTFYVQPVCSPSRAALLTGRHSVRTGVIDTEAGVAVLPPSEVTIAEVLHANGYATGLFGKWHLGDQAPARPQDQGFEQVLTHIGGMIGASYTPPEARSYFDPLLIENGVERRFSGYAPDIFTDATIAFIDDAITEKRPFFAYLAFNTPHHPLTVSDEYAAPYRSQGLSEETSRYYGMIANIDANVARVIATLRAEGVYDDTIILFMSDNGTSSLHTQSDLWESGLRGRKTYVYDNGVRAPLLIKAAGPNLRHGRREEPVIIQDIMPTILDLVGVQSDIAFDGMSIAPMFGSRRWSPPERALYFQFHRGVTPVPLRNVAVRRGDYKFVQPVGRGVEPFSIEAARFELYNLARDPNEQNDIASAHPEMIAEFKQNYADWFAATRNPNFTLVPIWIGEPSVPRVHLTRQDWQGASTSDNDNGVYELEVRTPGAYRLTFHWSELLDNTHNVTIMLGDARYERQILRSELEARIERVELAPGPVRLQAWIDFEGAQSGFQFVDIEKLPD